MSVSIVQKSALTFGKTFLKNLFSLRSPRKVDPVAAPLVVEVTSAKVQEAPAMISSEYEYGQEWRAQILKFMPGGGFIVMLPNSETGLVLRDEVSWAGYPVQYRKGEWVDVVVISFKPEKGLFLSIRRARSAERLKAIYETVRPGAVLDGKIKSVKDYGVFVSVGPGVQGLCHVSRIPDISIYGRHSIGQDVKVNVLSFDKVEERIQLEFFGQQY